ncbi:WD40-repeat-containing domain protein [Roridomyces roridus]|uniref:WD repeat-containing protein JIP5 n=1 Tax=Roridomyces roridus TaxID=1738132 RepID=A0AAD7BRP1_9AGAR|nr:WD40-repeat-containing domain protein [Roridomyces roridus]
MPDIPLGAQVFDLVFHPSHSTVYTALLTGQVKAFTFDQNTHKKSFSVRPSKRSCRTLAINDDGSRLYAAGKAKAIHTIDTSTGDIVETRTAAHDDPINRMKHVMPWLFATGDDAGVIKLWDPRQQESIRTHKQHFDYITDFLWLGDKHHLLATSGDGTLSVMDVRSKKSTPFAQSEDQEDELLSVTTIKGGEKVVVGTQLGILSIFNRARGYGDCVDRVPGHPSSIDALCSLPEELQNSAGMEDTVLTGSSDGYVRAVQFLPTKLVGVVADHGELPVERLAVGMAGAQISGGADDSEDDDDSDEPGEVVGKGKGKGKAKGDQEEEEEGDGAGPGRWWVGSVGHDETLRLTDLEAFFRHPTTGEEDGGNAEDVDEDDEESVGGADGDEVEDAGAGDKQEEEAKVVEAKAEEAEADSNGDDSDEAPTTTRKRKKAQKDPLAVRRKKGRNELEVGGSFFDDL